MDVMLLAERFYAHPREALFAAACLVLLVVPVLFILNQVYKDGVVGRLGLAGISIFAALFLFEIAFGKGYHVELEEVGLVVSFSTFLVWHLVRFHRRVLRNGREPA